MILYVCVANVSSHCVCGAVNFHYRCRALLFTLHAIRVATLDAMTAKPPPYRDMISNANRASRPRASISRDLEAGKEEARRGVMCHAALPSYTSSRRQIYGYPSHLQLVALLLVRGISAIPRGTHVAYVHTYLRLR